MLLKVILLGSFPRLVFTGLFPALQYDGPVYNDKASSKAAGNLVPLDRTPPVHESTIILSVPDSPVLLTVCPYRLPIPPFPSQTLILPKSLILRHLISKPLPRRHKLAQLPPHHLLRHKQLLVYLPVVDRKSIADELRQDGCGAGLGADGGCL